MYEAFFNLSKKPFNLTPDPSFVFLTEQHREALAGLKYAILAHKGLVVLTGEAGTGKTTLLSAALQQTTTSGLRSSFIQNTTVTPSEFLEMALLDFGITEVPDSKAQRISILHELLLLSRRENKTVALIIDEAHALKPEVLEEVRLLGNFECPDEKLLQIVLVGQPELGALLSEPSLRQLKQRIALRLKLERLSSPQVCAYVQHRWRVAGGHTPPFESDAIELISAASGGIPRLINSICDNALLAAFGDCCAIAGVQHVAYALADLDIPTPWIREYAAPVVQQPQAAAFAEARPPSNNQRRGIQPVLGLELPPKPAPALSLLDRWVEKFGFAQQNGKA